MMPTETDCKNSLGTGFQALGRLGRIARESPLLRFRMRPWARANKIVLADPVSQGQLAEWLSQYSPRPLTLSAVQRFEAANGEAPKASIQYAYVEAKILFLNGQPITHEQWMQVLFGRLMVTIDPAYYSEPIMIGDATALRALLLEGLQRALPVYPDNPVEALILAGDDLWHGPDRREIIQAAYSGSLPSSLIDTEFCAAIAWTLYQLTGMEGYTQEMVIRRLAVNS